MELIEIQEALKLIPNNFPVCLEDLEEIKRIKTQEDDKNTKK